MQAIKTGKDFTGFFLWRHKVCGATTRVFAGKGYFNGFGPDDKPLLVSVGDLHVELFGQYRALYVVCKGCGKHLGFATAKAIYGRYVESVTCNGKCTNAIGPACDCQCGGELHGSNH